jgi:putative FmdB family regulatory protein
MPIYEYVCGSCGRRIEMMHGIHGHGPAACESCGGPMRKALSAPAIHFKGSGWAKKDAKASSSGGARLTAGKDAGAAAEGTAKGTGSGSGETGGAQSGTAPTSGSTDD